MALWASSAFFPVPSPLRNSFPFDLLFPSFPFPFSLPFVSSASSLKAHRSFPLPFLPSGFLTFPFPLPLSPLPLPSPPFDCEDFFSHPLPPFPS